MSDYPSKKFDNETKKRTELAVQKLQDIILNFHKIDYSLLSADNSKKKIFDLNWGTKEVIIDPLFAKAERYKKGDFGLVDIRNHKKMRVEVECREIDWHFKKILSRSWNEVHWFYRKINTHDPANWCVSFSPSLDYCYMFASDHVLRHASDEKNIQVYDDMKRPGSESGADIRRQNSCLAY